MSILSPDDLSFVAALAVEAGKAILDVYGTEFTVERKEDNSPLTLADKASHEIIARGLSSRFPDIPVLSEEGREVSYEIRKGWTRFWCVDPLDGTKEFIKRNGEFTVNIALIEDGVPTAGVIYLPVKEALYLADTSTGCRCIRNRCETLLTLAPLPLPGDAALRVLRSRSHPSPYIDELLTVLPPFETLNRGSSLKFCAVAAGEADFYPRLGPTCEWDTAAGQAIVTAAGGAVVDLTGRPFRYNKSNIVNGPFLVGRSLEWLEKSGILKKVAELDLI